MSAIGDLVATLGMNISPFQQAASRAAQAAQQIEQKVGASFAKVRSSGANLLSGIGLGGLGGVIAGGISAGGIFASISAAGEAARAQKRLGVILEATGAAADLSKNDLVEYASQLMKVTNYDDDATISAMGTLAVFKQRLSGDMFKDAIKAAMDINSVMGGDLNETTRKLGMALADPAKGMRLLKSEGVLFNAVQQQQIANAMKNNDLVGAQRVIMEQVNATFGGSAEKMASPMTQLRNQLEDIGKQFGALILPYVRQFGTTLSSSVSLGVVWFGSLREQFSGLFGILGGLWQSFASSPMAVAIAAAVPAVLALAVGLGSLMPIASGVGGVLASVFAFVAGPAGAAVAAIGMVGAAVASLQTQGATMLERIQNATPAIIGIGAAATLAFGLITGPIGAVVAGVLTVAGAFVYVGLEGDTMQEKIGNALAWIKDTAQLAGFAWRNFGNVAKLAVVDLALMVLERFPQMAQPMTSTAAAFIGAWAGVKAFFGAIIGHMKGSMMEFKNLCLAIGDGISAAWSAMMSGNFSGMASAFTGAFQKTLASQPNVEAPNAFVAAKEAFDEASGSFNKMVHEDGGMKSFLTNQRGAISAAIAANEKLNQAGGGTTGDTPGTTGGNRPKWTPPNLTTPDAGGKTKGTSQQSEGPKALEAGSAEAWKAIVSAQTQQEDAELRKLQEDTARNTGDAVGLLSTIADRLDSGTVEIGG